MVTHQLSSGAGRGNPRHHLSPRYRSPPAKQVRNLPTTTALAEPSELLLAHPPGKEQEHRHVQGCTGSLSADPHPNQESNRCAPGAAPAAQPARRGFEDKPPPHYVFCLRLQQNASAPLLPLRYAEDGSAAPVGTLRHLAAALSPTYGKEWRSHGQHSHP